MQQIARRPLSAIVALLAAILPSGSISETERLPVRTESPVLLRSMPELPRPEALEQVTAPASSEVFSTGQGTGALERALSEITGARGTRGEEAAPAAVGEERAAAPEQGAIPTLAELGSVQEHTRRKGLLEYLGSRLERLLRTRAQTLLTPESLRSLQAGGSRHLASSLHGAVTGELDAVTDAILAAGAAELQGRLPFLRSLELHYRTPYGGREDLFRLGAMLALMEHEQGALFGQLEGTLRDREGGFNIGLGYRFDVTDGLQLGLNLFYDWLSEPDLQRASAGLELRTRLLDLGANFYDALDSSSEDRDGSVEYALGGWDAELAGRLPVLPWLEAGARYYKWNRRFGAEDLEGQEYSLRARPTSLLELSLRYDDPEQGATDWGIDIALHYEFGRSWREQAGWLSSEQALDLRARRFERVRRQYEIRTQRMQKGQFGTADGNSCTQRYTGTEQCVSFTVSASDQGRCVTLGREVCFGIGLAPGVERAVLQALQVTGSSGGGMITLELDRDESTPAPESLTGQRGSAYAGDAPAVRFIVGTCAALDESDTSQVPAGMTVAYEDSSGNALAGSGPYGEEARARYSCSAGYVGTPTGTERTEGGDLRVCTSGSWAGSVPMGGCTAECAALDASDTNQVPAGMTVAYEEAGGEMATSPYVAGTRARYSCSMGYVGTPTGTERTEGGDLRVCTSGSWAGSVPMGGCTAECAALDASDTNQVPAGMTVAYEEAGGEMATSPYVAGTRARYSCSMGYVGTPTGTERTEGGDLRVCTSGSWAGSVPMGGCTVECAALDASDTNQVPVGMTVAYENAGGEMAASPYGGGTRVVYSCSTGYVGRPTGTGRTEGGDLRVCTSGSWAGSVPMGGCPATTCNAAAEGTGIAAGRDVANGIYSPAAPYMRGVTTFKVQRRNCGMQESTIETYLCNPGAGSMWKLTGAAATCQDTCSAAAESTGIAANRDVAKGIYSSAMPYIRPTSFSVRRSNCGMQGSTIEIYLCNPSADPMWTLTGNKATCQDTCSAAAESTGIAANRDVAKGIYTSAEHYIPFSAFSVQRSDCGEMQGSTTENYICDPDASPMWKRTSRVATCLDTCSAAAESTGIAANRDVANGIYSRVANTQFTVERNNCGAQFSTTEDYLCNPDAEAAMMWMRRGNAATCEDEPRCQGRYRCEGVPVGVGSVVIQCPPVLGGGITVYELEGYSSRGLGARYAEGDCTCSAGTFACH